VRGLKKRSLFNIKQKIKEFNSRVSQRKKKPEAVNPRIMLIRRLKRRIPLLFIK
jgi:hypothetical protein